MIKARLYKFSSSSSSDFRTACFLCYVFSRKLRHKMLWEQHSSLLPTVLARKVMNPVVSVRLSVRLFPLLTFEPSDILNLIFAGVWVMTTARRGLKIKVIGPGRAGFKGRQTGQLPRASTTKGLQRKTIKKLLPKET